MAEPVPQLSIAGKRRVPLVLACAAFATGIAGNEFLKPSLEFWSGGFGISLLVCVFLQWFRSRRQSTGIVLAVCFFCAGGLRHYSEFSRLPANEISRFVTDEPQPARILARLLETPQLQEPRESFFQTPWKQQEFSSARIECLKLNGKQPVSGQAILRIAGKYSAAEAGDIVEILGQLSAPRAPVNPGEFDYRQWLDRQGVRAIVRCELPNQVRLVEKVPVRPANFFPRLRQRLLRRLTETLPGQEADLAAALLLGVRTNLTEETRRTFIRSGTFHLLAISGLHIGIIAYLLNLVFRLVNLSFRASAILTVICLVCYLLLTEFRPSVFRAVVLISLYLFGTCTFRTVNGLNLLCATALLMLLIRPAELFSAGAQLSFLAVLGIFAVQPLCQRFRISSTLRGQASGGLHNSQVRRIVRWIGRNVQDGLLIGIGVTLMTFPALVYHYGLFAVGGIPVTVLLIPVIALSIAAGLIVLISLPAVSSIAAAILVCLLQFVQFVASSVASWSFSTTSVSAASAVWIGAYLLAASIPLWSGSGARLRVWGPCLVAFAWGMTGGSPADRSEGALRVTFFSVGHGLAMAIENPDGSFFLYDAGSSEGGGRVASAVRSFLRSRGARTIETIFLSHADFDHYSGIPELIENLEVRSVVSTEQLRKSQESNLIRLREFLQRRGVPLRTVSAGDNWTIGNRVNVRVLHPVSEKDYDSDNAASLVLELSYAGRTILLTGDLNRTGFEELRRSGNCDVDCLLAPHHGSLDDNPPEFAAWAKPELVIVSSGNDTRLPSLFEVYGPGLEHTLRSGAVTVTISARGELTVERMREPALKR
ncbi:MAG TPA: DNA internalization-related competence protein ComEC/Rec2 [Planctomycetaceae bacterium]|nr:DNA internalization-related competence protein ComEC/Rec2 [Planctomycetaceae bacterium]